jgi:drug/metabolite transporter (DMT)-like permease
MLSHMKQELFGYWLGGAISLVIGAAIIGGMDFGPTADIFSIALTLTASFLLTALGGLLWMIGATRLGPEE